MHALSAKLSWTHLKTLIYINDNLKRSFYTEMCKMEKWSTRTLQERIDAMLYERTAISKKPNETIQNELNKLKDTQQLTPDLVLKTLIFWTF